MRGDRVEVVIDTGQGGIQTFEIVATRAGRRIVALVEHPAAEGSGTEKPVDVSTHRRMGAGSADQ